MNRNKKRGENLKEKVYSILKQRIIHFQLKPGERIQERELSKELGVSRTPIREALNRMGQEGFIKALPNQGYFVAQITTKEVEELYKVRGALETLAIREAVQKGTRKDWSRLKQILSSSGKTHEIQRTKRERFDIGRIFHEEIARISGNLTLEQMLKGIFEKIDRIRWVDIFFIDRAEESLQGHLEILKYLEKGKAEEAITANQKHIQMALEKVLHLLRRKMDLFYIT